MSGLDKNRKRNHVVSFRLSPTEFKNLEARIEVSGLKKNKYHIDSCLYGRIVVVGSRQNVDRLIVAINEMELMLKVLADEIKQGEYKNTLDKINDVKNEYYSMVSSLIELINEADKQVSKKSLPIVDKD